MHYKLSNSDHDGFIRLPFHTAHLKHLLGELLPIFVDLLIKRKKMKIIFLIFKGALVCQRTFSYFERGSAKELGQSVWCRQMQRWLDFKFSSSPKDPKRAPTGLGNSTDCGVRGSQRKVKHQNTKKSNTPRLKHKNTQKWNTPQLSSIPWLPSGGPPMSQEQPMITYINLWLLKWLSNHPYWSSPPTSWSRSFTCWISSSLLLRNCSQAASNISSFWPWIFTWAGRKKPMRTIYSVFVVVICNAMLQFAT